MVFMGKGRGRGGAQYSSGVISATTRKEKRTDEYQRHERDRSRSPVAKRPAVERLGPQREEEPLESLRITVGNEIFKDRHSRSPLSDRLGPPVKRNESYDEMKYHSDARYDELYGGNDDEKKSRSNRYDSPHSRSSRDHGRRSDSYEHDWKSSSHDRDRSRRSSSRDRDRRERDRARHDSYDRYSDRDKRDYSSERDRKDYGSRERHEDRGRAGSYDEHRRHQSDRPPHEKDRYARENYPPAEAQDRYRMPDTYTSPYTTSTPFASAPPQQNILGGGDNKPLKSILKKSAPEPSPVSSGQNICYPPTAPTYNHPDAKKPVPKSFSGLPGMSSYMDIEDEERFLYGEDNEDKSRKDSRSQHESVMRSSANKQPQQTTPYPTGYPPKNSYPPPVATGYPPKDSYPPPAAKDMYPPYPTHDFRGSTDSNQSNRKEQELMNFFASQKPPTIPPSSLPYPPAPQQTTKPDEKKTKYDPTIENILKSIGFDFEMSKRMQERANPVPQQPKDDIHKYSIDQASSFLGGELSEDIKKEIFPVKSKLEKESMVDVLLREAKMTSPTSEKAKSIPSRDTSKDRRDSYSDDRRRDSYSEDRKRDSYSDDRKRDLYSEDRKRDSYSDDRKRDLYSDDRKRDSYSDDRRRDSYSDSRKRDSYSDDRRRDSHGDDRSRSSVPVVSQPATIPTTYTAPPTSSYPPTAETYPVSTISSTSYAATSTAATSYPYTAPSAVSGYSSYAGAPYTTPPPYSMPPPGHPGMWRPPPGYPPYALPPRPYGMPPSYPPTGYPPYGMPPPTSGSVLVDSSKLKESTPSTTKIMTKKQSNLKNIELTKKSDDSPPKKKETKTITVVKKVKKVEKPSSKSRDKPHSSSSSSSNRTVLPPKSKTIVKKPIIKSSPKVNEKEKIVIKKVILTPREKEKLSKEKENSLQRLKILEQELSSLRKQQNELMRKKRRQKDGHKDPILLQNSKLQEEITKQISKLRQEAEEKAKLLKDAQVDDSTAPSTPKRTRESSSSRGSPHVTDSPAKKARTERSPLTNKSSNQRSAEKYREKPKQTPPSKKETTTSDEKKKLVENKAAATKMLVSSVKETEVKKVEIPIEKDTYKPILPVKKVKYEFFDPGNHWCKTCNIVCSSLSNLLFHLHGKKHQNLVNKYDRPWLPEELKDENKAKEKPPNKDDVKVEVSPIKGQEFFMATKGYFCTLCKEHCGDNLSAEYHVKSESHYQKYQEFTKDNPFYEQRLNLDKAAGMALYKEEEQKKEKQVPEVMDVQKETAPEKPKEVSQRMEAKKLEQKKKIQAIWDKHIKTKKDEKPSDNKPAPIEEEKDKGKIQIHILSKGGIKSSQEPEQVKKTPVLPPWTPVSTEMKVQPAKADLPKKSVEEETTPSLDDFITIGDQNDKIPVVTDADKTITTDSLTETVTANKEEKIPIVEEEQKKEKVENEKEKEGERKDQKNQKQDKDLAILAIDPKDTQPNGEVKPPPPPSQNLSLPSDNKEKMATTSSDEMYTLFFSTDQKLICAADEKAVKFKADDIVEIDTRGNITYVSDDEEEQPKKEMPKIKDPVPIDQAKASDIVVISLDSQDEESTDDEMDTSEPAVQQTVAQMEVDNKDENLTISNQQDSIPDSSTGLPIQVLGNAATSKAAESTISVVQSRRADQATPQKTSPTAIRNLTNLHELAETKQMEAKPQPTEKIKSRRISSPSKKPRSYRKKSTDTKSDKKITNTRSGKVAPRLDHLAEDIVAISDDEGPEYENVDSASDFSDNEQELENISSSSEKYETDIREHLENVSSDSEIENDDNKDALENISSDEMEGNNNVMQTVDEVGEVDFFEDFDFNDVENVVDQVGESDEETDKKKSSKNVSQMDQMDLENISEGEDDQFNKNDDVETTSEQIDDEKTDNDKDKTDLSENSSNKDAVNTQNDAKEKSTQDEEKNITIDENAEKMDVNQDEIPSDDKKLDAEVSIVEEPVEVEAPVKAGRGRKRGRGRGRGGSRRGARRGRSSGKVSEELQHVETEEEIVVSANTTQEIDLNVAMIEPEETTSDTKNTTEDKGDDVTIINIGDATKDNDEQATADDSVNDIVEKEETNSKPVTPRRGRKRGRPAAKKKTPSKAQADEEEIELVENKSGEQPQESEKSQEEVPQQGVVPEAVINMVNSSNIVKDDQEQPNTEEEKELPNTEEEKELPNNEEEKELPNTEEEKELSNDICESIQTSEEKTINSIDPSEILSTPDKNVEKPSKDELQLQDDKQHENNSRDQVPECIISGSSYTDIIATENLLPAQIFESETDDASTDVEMKQDNSAIDNSEVNEIEESVAEGVSESCNEDQNIAESMETTETICDNKTVSDTNIDNMDSTLTDENKSQTINQELNIDSVESQITQTKTDIPVTVESHNKTTNISELVHLDFDRLNPVQSLQEELTRDSDNASTSSEIKIDTVLEAIDSLSQFQSIGRSPSNVEDSKQKEPLVDQVPVDLTEPLTMGTPDTNSEPDVKDISVDLSLNVRTDESLGGEDTDRDVTISNMDENDTDKDIISLEMDEVLSEGSGISMDMGSDFEVVDEYDSEPE